MRILPLMLAFGHLLTIPLEASGPFAELSVARIAAIENMLPAAPKGFGEPISNRGFWKDPATVLRAGESIHVAEEFIGMALPAWNDELYLEFSKSGRRPPGERMIRSREDRLGPLVLAECLENNGRFLPAITAVLEGFLEVPCWTLPAHDDGLKNFCQEAFTVDLHSAALAANIAQTIHLLDDRLPEQLRQRAMGALEARTFAPMRQTFKTNKGHFWLGSESDPVKNNWNAVCLAGVVGAARTVIQDRHDRAVFIAAGEHYSRYFINGFRDDGYCDEGPGYWVYGFGSFVALRELIVEATSGKVDLFDQPKTYLMATFGERIRFPLNDVPPFADCRAGSRMNTAMLDYCANVFRGKTTPTARTDPDRQKDLATFFMTMTPSATGKDTHLPDALNRSFFSSVGVLVCRPGENSRARISAAIKSGGNNSHSHNDIGSFVISLDGEQPVGDPGGPFAYDNKTFGPRRYDYRILNSFGHPVPVVDGHLQVDATTITPKVIETRFTSDSDSISIDMTPAYGQRNLKKLTRTMTYSRAGSGSVVIEDRPVFTKASSFEIALTTRWDFVRTTPRTLEFSHGGRKLIVEVTTPDGFELTETTVAELDAPPFKRLGLKLKKPVVDATTRICFTTVP